MADPDTIAFVRKQAAGAKYVTSVCTGAFILGVAGLLKGRRATTHWAFADLLPLVGATHEKARVVRDGNVITAGGVTSGIDFGLSVVAEIAGETAARTIQLGIEYDPGTALRFRPSRSSAERHHVGAPERPLRQGPIGLPLRPRESGPAVTGSRPDHAVCREQRS